MSLLWPRNASLHCIQNWTQNSERLNSKFTLDFYQSSIYFMQTGQELSFLNKIMSDSYSYQVWC